MRGARFSVLTTWPFVLALTTLIVNDAWLKSEWPGLITGKLSDFAGIAVVMLLALHRVPQRRLLVFSVIAVAFAWWKSPGSQPLIDAVNILVPGTAGRTVDYSDLIALLVMPLCAGVARRAEDFALPGAGVRRMLLAPIGIATIFGLMATTLPPVQQDYKVRTIESSSELNRAKVAQAIEIVAREYKLVCSDCVDPLVRARFEGKGFELSYVFDDARTVVFKVWGPSDGFVGHGNRDKLDRLRTDLKKQLRDAQVGLEFIQPIDAQYPL